MMLDVQRGLLLVACVSAGFVISAGPGLVARAAEPERWVKAIAASPTATSADAAQHRVAELEQRIKTLEAERRAQQGSGQAGELAAVMARNEQLTARNLSLSVENRELVRRRAPEPSEPASAALQPLDDADPRAQLRYWAKQVRDGEASVRRLSPEWNSAINVLLRRERELDPQNPWRER